MILRINNFYDGEINEWNTLKRLTIEDNEYKIYALQNDDIIVNRVNSIPFLGKSAIVRNLPEPCVFESNMMRIKFNNEIVSPFYIIRYLNSMPGLEELRKNAKHAVNQASINQKDVKAVLVPLPTLKEQNEIVRRIEQLFAFADKIETRYTKAKAILDKLPQSILSKAFRGELVPQDPDDEPARVLLERIRAEKEKLGRKGDKKRKPRT
jgi:type I restriction enzyme S subunit